MCRARRRQRDDQGRAGLRSGIGCLRREFLAERIRRRQQEGKKPGLPARDPGRCCVGPAVLYAEHRAVQRDCDVGVLATPDAREQGKTGESEADPQRARERRRRCESRRLEGRQDPRSHRGPCGFPPHVLHLSPTAGACLNIVHLGPRRRPPTEGDGLQRTATARREKPLPASPRRRR